LIAQFEPGNTQLKLCFWQYYGAGYLVAHLREHAGDKVAFDCKDRKEGWKW
jgi:hypothetical protein